MQIEVSDELSGEIVRVTQQCIANMGAAMESEYRLDATTMLAASGAVNACANLWQAVGAYGTPEGEVILTRDETKEHLREWAKRTGATVEEGVEE